MIQCCSHITCSLVVTEIRCFYITSEVTTEVSTTSFRKRTVRTSVNRSTATETYLRTIIETWNTTEGEHQREILCPLSVRAAKTTCVAGLLRTIVVTIYIYYIIGSIIIFLVTGLCQTVCGGSITEVVVQWEVNHIETACLRIVWLMPLTIHHKGIVTCWCWVLV